MWVKSTMSGHRPFVLFLHIFCHEISLIFFVSVVSRWSLSFVIYLVLLPQDDSRLWLISCCTVTFTYKIIKDNFFGKLLLQLFFNNIWNKIYVFPRSAILCKSMPEAVAGFIQGGSMAQIIVAEVLSGQ